MVAMSECGPQGCGGGLQYFLTDHLDSVVAVANASGGLVSQQRYMPFGEVRTDVGTITQTDFGYTGQRNLDAQGNSFQLGLMDYKARFYYPYLHHFLLSAIRSHPTCPILKASTPMLMCGTTQFDITILRDMVRRFEFGRNR